jgi:hypothetical protein
VRAFAPHVLACTSRLTDQVADRQLIEVLQKAADYLRERARYDQAELLYLLQEQASEADRLPLAFLLNNLAILAPSRENTSGPNSCIRMCCVFGSRPWAQTISR